MLLPFRRNFRALGGAVVALNFSCSFLRWGWLRTTTRPFLLFLQFLHRLRKGKILLSFRPAVVRESGDSADDAVLAVGTSTEQHTRISAAQRRVASSLSLSRGPVTQGQNSARFISAPVTRAVSFTGSMTGASSLTESTPPTTQNVATQLSLPVPQPGTDTEVRAHAAEERRILSLYRGRGRGRGGSSNYIPGPLRDASTISPQALFSGNGGERQSRIRTDIEPQFRDYESAQGAAISTYGFAQPSLPSTSGATLSPVPSDSSTQLLGLDFFRLSSNMAAAAGVNSTQFSEQFILALTDIARARDSSLVVLNGQMPQIIRLETLEEEGGRIMAVCSQPQFRSATGRVQDVSEIYVMPNVALGHSLAPSSAQLSPLCSFFQQASTMCSRSWINSNRADGFQQHSKARQDARPDPLYAFPCTPGHARPDTRPEAFAADGGERDSEQGSYDDRAEEVQRHPVYRPPRPDHLRPPEFGKTDIFRKWRPGDERPYKGDCRLGSELADYTSLPHLWLDHMQELFNFFGIEI